MKCTVALLIALSGVPKGSVIVVPASELKNYTPTQIERAKACARSHGVTPKIDWNR